MKFALLLLAILGIGSATAQASTPLGEAPLKLVSSQLPSLATDYDLQYVNVAGTLVTPATTKTIDYVIGSLYAVSHGTVTYTFLGSEAADTNMFFDFTKSGQSFSSAASKVGDSFTDVINKAGYLKFFFSTTAPKSDVVTIGNTNPLRNDASFGIVENYSMKNAKGVVTTYQYALLFNDCGGNGCKNGWKDDKDYDDMVIGINGQVLVAVPEPEIYAMLLAGLGFLAYLARRRRPGV